MAVFFLSFLPFKTLLLNQQPKSSSQKYFPSSACKTTQHAMDSKPRQRQLKPFKIYWVSSIDSTEFTLLSWALNRSPLIALDAEWKPSTRSPPQSPSFPTVTLLQIACRFTNDSDEQKNDPWVFLIDLSAIHLPSIWEVLQNAFVSPNVLKLGFKLKQDLIYLSSTFCSAGCDMGFDRVEPFLDITTVYHHLKQKHSFRNKHSKDTKSLASICQDVLGVSLSKELQCSDWSCRPLTEEQQIYAAADAECLLEIFSHFEDDVPIEGNEFNSEAKLDHQNAVVGLKGILEKSDDCGNIVRIKFCPADLVRSTTFSEIYPTVLTAFRSISTPSCGNTIHLDVSLSTIVRKYGEKILLKESDRKPRSSRRKGKKHASVGLTTRTKCVDNNCSSWEGPPPWDLSFGGDGCPKFLCDVMVEGLAKHLRCVGIDAAIPYSRKPEARQLIEQAEKEKRVLLTRDAKLLRHDYLIRNQIYRVKGLLKNEQLLEVIETFQLNICEDRLMSRCTKCNGRFIQKLLTTEEAIEASKGFQVIPKCLFKKNLEFWQCMDCNQVYWEGTQYHNAIQKFVDICKLNGQQEGETAVASISV